MLATRGSVMLLPDVQAWLAGAERPTEEVLDMFGFEKLEAMERIKVALVLGQELGRDRFFRPFM
jgi:hypothetical protein